MTITALPTAPNRLDTPATFDAAVGAFLTALPTMVSEINAVLPTIEAAAAEASAAAASALAAEASATAAATAAGAALWVSGQAYLQYASAISPLTLQTYRARMNTSGVIDPSLDGDNWASIGATTSPAAAVFAYQNFGGF